MVVVSCLVASCSVVRADRSSMTENLIQRHRLVVPVHTSDVVYLVPDALGIQLLSEINLEVRLIGEVAVTVKMNPLVSVSVVHRDEVMAEYASSCCAIFQRDADIIIVLNCGEYILCFGVTEESIVISLDQNDLTVQTIDNIQCFIIFSFPDHVTEDIDKIASVNLRVPSADKLCIHLIDRRKRSVIKADDILMPEVEIACKIYLAQWIIFFLLAAAFSNSFGSSSLIIS